MIVGENKLKINKTILLVGESGAGKSTLINALFNYTIGVKFEDEIWFKIVEEEERSQTESQTSDVIVYQMSEGQSLPYSLTIIDTPGYGSTQGIEHDVIVSQRLLDLFQAEDGVHELHAVGLVVKATDNRLSDRLRYIFDSVVSLFGKDLEKNIVVLITHSDGRRPKNALKALEAANIKCARNEKNEPLHFLFDNCQSEDRTDEDDIEKLKQSFHVTENGINQLANFIGGAEAQRLGTTLDVLKARIHLAACIHNLQERIQLGELKQIEIRQTRDALERCEEKLKSGEAFTIEVDEVYKNKEKVDGGSWGLRIFYEGATCCLDCQENCHYPCTMAWYPSHCMVMSKGNCTVCTKKCPISAHVKEEWRYVNKTRKVKKTLKDVKKKYEVKKEGMSGILAALKEEKCKLDKETNEYLEEAYMHVMKLEQIALNVNSMTTFLHLDVLIEKMMQRGEKDKIQKLVMIQKRQDKAVASVMKSFYNKLKFVWE
ncbi:uncharacterized protein FYW61_004107 isoform 2-T3 [Anableps anableps]